MRGNPVAEVFQELERRGDIRTRSKESIAIVEAAVEAHGDMGDGFDAIARLEAVKAVADALQAPPPKAKSKANKKEKSNG